MQGTVAGFIGQDATVNPTANGNVAIGFSVAEKIYNGKETVTQWIKCTIFKQAGKDSISEYLKKGTIVACTGECTLNIYQKQTGETVAQIQMIANHIQLLGGGRKDEIEEVKETYQKYTDPRNRYPLTTQEVYAKATAPKDNPPDDLPF